MVIKFKATDGMPTYNGFWQTAIALVVVQFLDGQAQDVPDGKGEELLAGFPQNFSREIATPPADRMIRKTKTK
jgi:hypothetical protein